MNYIPEEKVDQLDPPIKEKQKPTKREICPQRSVIIIDDPYHVLSPVQRKKMKANCLKWMEKQGLYAPRVSYTFFHKEDLPSKLIGEHQA